MPTESKQQKIEDGKESMTETMKNGDVCMSQEKEKHIKSRFVDPATK